MNKEELREKRNRTIETLDDIKAVLGLDELYIDELEKRNAELKSDNDARKYAMAMSEKVEKQLRKENAELKEQIEKLIDFVLSKTECCDVCPITDTCINSEGTCPYAGILAKGEEEVTREWLMQFISKEIKENG